MASPPPKRTITFTTPCKDASPNAASSSSSHRGSTARTVRVISIANSYFRPFSQLRFRHVQGFGVDAEPPFNEDLFPFTDSARSFSNATLVTYATRHQAEKAIRIAKDWCEANDAILDDSRLVIDDSNDTLHFFKTEDCGYIVKGPGTRLEHAWLGMDGHSKFNSSEKQYEYVPIMSMYALHSVHGYNLIDESDPPCRKLLTYMNNPPPAEAPCGLLPIMPLPASVFRRSSSSITGGPVHSDPTTATSTEPVASSSTTPAEDATDAIVTTGNTSFAHEDDTTLTGNHDDVQPHAKKPRKGKRGRDNM